MAQPFIIEPLFSFIFSLIVFISQNIVVNSNALRIPIILPNSPESPTYIKNITRIQTIKNLVHHSRNRARSIYYSKTSNGTSKFTQLELASRQELHVTYPPVIHLKLGIGTFNNPIPYKSHYVQMDTGSEIIWVQCEDCQKHNQCFGNPPEFFRNTKSYSYYPIPCDTHKLCYCGECIDGFCSYSINYGDGSSAGGIFAFETFNFGIGARQNDITGESMIFNLVFGCNQFFSGPDHMKQAIGLLGLGWGPRSLMSQIKTQIEDIFSYCFPHYDESALGVQGYLKLGLEENLENDFSSTAMQQFKDSDYYYLNLEGISVNNKKLPILSSVFIRKNNNEGGTIIDSGNSFTQLTPRAYKVLEKTLLAYFRSLRKNYKPIRGSEEMQKFNLCYTSSRYKAEDLPSITFHFAGSDLLLKSENVFIWLDNRPSNNFCLAIFPCEENLSILGAYQQSNFKFVYDRRRMLLLFKPEDHCHQNT